MGAKRDKRGVFFTIAILLLVLPLILLVTFYLNISKTKTTDVAGKVRCDELHYFVEDIRQDMERAMVIFGRRAAIYAISDVVTSGEGLQGYRFNCSGNCTLDNCKELYFTETGAEAAIAELMVCGTLHGEVSPYVVNHTFSVWMDKLEDLGKNNHFTMNLTLRSIKIVPLDAWNFATMADMMIRIEDESGMCYYEYSILSTMSNTSIEGLEDPLYSLNSLGRITKHIQKCTPAFDLERVAGCSLNDTGNGSVGGTAVFWSNISSDYNLTERQTYCTDRPEVNSQILIVDKGFGALCNQLEQCCFNISCSNHFAGVINYGKNNPATTFIGKCNVTIPWISGTCKLDDNVTNFGPGPGCTRPPGCDEANITYVGECIFIRNIPERNMHQVLIGINTSEIDTSCYLISDVDEHYNSFCPLVNHSNGPSFFDRLDGNLTLSDKYKNQANTYFGNTTIGLESLLSPDRFDEYGIFTPRNLTWVAYLRWQNVTGCAALGACQSENHQFMLDCPHAYKHGVDTECEIINISNETCINCVDDDGDGQVDWNDTDCSSYFSAGCGRVHYCDPNDDDNCAGVGDDAGSCDMSPPTQISDNSSSYCNHYGFNTTEWHFYNITPAIDGTLTINFTGNAAVSGSIETDLLLYNHTDGGCSSPYQGVKHNIESNNTWNFNVSAGKTYIIALDVDSDSCGKNGSYTLTTQINL